MSTGRGWIPSGGRPSHWGPSPKLRTSGGGFIEGNFAPRRPRTSGGCNWANAAGAAPVSRASTNAAVTTVRTPVIAFLAFLTAAVAAPIMPDGFDRPGLGRLVFAPREHEHTRPGPSLQWSPDGVDWRMRHIPSACLPVCLAAVLVLTAAPDSASQRFYCDRSFNAAPGSVVDISTMRGAIEVTGGSAGQVAIKGTATVRIGFNVPVNAVELARRVAANPPVRQDGNTITL